VIKSRGSLTDNRAFAQSRKFFFAARVLNSSFVKREHSIRNNTGKAAVFVAGLVRLRTCAQKYCGQPRLLSDGDNSTLNEFFSRSVKGVKR
jgi:hypothetical protein